jgi:hypothetical protein
LFLLLFLILAVQDVYATPCIDGRTTAPCLERLELINGDALGSANTDGGNGWGSNRLRSVRTSTDEIFATVTGDGVDNLNNRNVWLYKRSTTGGWTRVYNTEDGRTSAQIIMSSNDRLNIIGQPKELPVHWYDSGKNWLSPITTEDMSVDFPYKTETPYDGVAVQPGSSNLWYVATKTAQPYIAPNSAYFWGVKNAITGLWTKGQINTDVRMAYHFVVPIPQTANGAYFVSQSDVYWSDVRMTQPSTTTFPYVADRIEMWYSPDWTTIPPTKSVVKQVFQSKGEYVEAALSDAYLDINGKLHIIYHSQDLASGSVVHQAIYSQNTQSSDTIQSFACGNNARMTQDLTAKFFVASVCGSNMYVYPGTDSSGTQFGTPITLNLSQFPVSGWHSFAALRGGTPLSNMVDGVYSTNSDQQMAYFRIRLNDSPTPTPTPSKTGDLDGNNKVDIFDYNILLTNFGKTGIGIVGDIDNDGKVSIFDYNDLLTNFGK